MDHLKKAANDLALSKSQAEKIESLTRAFELFSQETNRLENAYTSLQLQFATLTKELEIANAKLEQKAIELNINTHYNDSILSKMSQGLMFIDLNGKITTYNRAAEYMLGKDRAEVVNKYFLDVFPDKLFHFSMKKALEDAESPKIDNATINPADHPGEQRELMIETTFILRGEEPATENAGEFPADFDYTLGMIVFFRDVTEIRRLQVIATRNDRMKELGEMAAMVAHEIRNPLGGIKGFASLLVRDLKDNPKQQEMASYIVKGTDNLNNLVSSVLNYARPIKLDLKLTSLNALIEETLRHVRMDDNFEKAMQIKTKFPPQTIDVMIDAQSIKSVLLNLFVNANQAMPNGGTLTIDLSKDENWAIIKVSDTGVGIASENLEKIFRPFFTTKPQGHGFGLSEVYRVIQAHNGTIDVGSLIDQGASFTIKIPLRP